MRRACGQHPQQARGHCLSCTLQSAAARLCYQASFGKHGWLRRWSGRSQANATFCPALAVMVGTGSMVAASPESSCVLVTTPTRRTVQLHYYYLQASLLANAHIVRHCTFPQTQSHHRPSQAITVTRCDTVLRVASMHNRSHGTPEAGAVRAERRVGQCRLA